jgi:hypothetical protein
MMWQLSQHKVAIAGLEWDKIAAPASSSMTVRCTNGRTLSVLAVEPGHGRDRGDEAQGRTVRRMRVRPRAAHGADAKRRSRLHCDTVIFRDKWFSGTLDEARAALG